MPVVDVIPHYSTEAIVKPTLEEVVTVDTSSLSIKTAQPPEGNVDVEPSSSMDDSSMIMIEIGVDVYEGPRPNHDDRRWSAVLGRAKVTSRAGDEDADVVVDLWPAIGPFADHTAEISMKAPMSVPKPADLG